MAALSPQNARLLAALRGSANRSLHSHDCREQLRVGDPAKRIGELRELGYTITSTIERRGHNHGVRYVLEAEPAGLRGAATPQGPRAVPAAATHTPEPGGNAQDRQDAHRAEAAHRPSPGSLGAVLDHFGRRCFPVPPASRHTAPEPGCVWVVDCDPASPLHGSSYWRAPQASEQQMELAA